MATPMPATAQPASLHTKSGITACEITNQQARLWTETRAAFLWNCPAFSHVLYTMMNPTGSEYLATFSKDVPVAATDGTSVIINPDTFFKLPLAERVFILAHEVMHGIWDHCGLGKRLRKAGEVRYPDGTKLPYQHTTMNKATDYIINDALIEARVGSFPTMGLHDPSIANGNDGALDAYRKVFDDEEKKGKGGGEGDGEGEGKGGFDQHLEPDDNNGNGNSQRNETEWKQAVAAGLAAAKAQGKMPASLERMLGEVLEPEVDWTDKIDAFFARKVGTGGYDWRRPDRRLITRDDPVYAPGRSGHAAGTVIVAVDTSGSIAADPGIIDRFFAEVGGILEDVRPKRLMVIWCDAQVHRVDEVEDAQDLRALRMKPVPGWGGTSFVPVFEYIAKEDLVPDALIYLTDGDGSFPDKAPSYPVLWGDISKSADKYPWGDVVVCPIKGS